MVSVIVPVSLLQQRINLQVAVTADLTENDGEYKCPLFVFPDFPTAMPLLLRSSPSAVHGSGPAGGAEGVGAVAKAAGSSCYAKAGVCDAPLMTVSVLTAEDKEDCKM